MYKSDRTAEELEGVTLLGNNNGTTYDSNYKPEVLEAFVNKHPEREYVVTLDAYEFTSRCPRTQQPDFAKVVISYIPRVKMVESKSLKLYLGSFRNEGSFHEDCMNTVLNDLVKLMDPKYLEVRGIFAPRGGIAIFPFVNYVAEDCPHLKDLYKQRQLDVLRDSANRTVRYDFG